MPSAPTSSGELIDLLRKSGVAAPDKLAGVSDLALPGDPQKAAAALVAQGVVTRFQAQQLLAGRHRGFRIGAYIIQDLLGRGGMGAVYLAEHLELHRKVAVKVLVPGKDEDHKLALERFQREARAAAALDHPNIVRIFDVSRHNDTPYLVMEYVEGETLQQILDRDGAIPYPTAAEYVAQAAAGLQHAHEKGFVHRDIKPGNLIRDRSGTIKILDMGLARSSEAKDRLTEQLDNGAVVGTADFIAPEQGLNQPGVDGRADIYSLGATFFSLIIGKPPFQGNTTQKLLQHQLRSAPTLASLDATLPKGLSAVVAKMLAKKPADRYQSPAEAIAALAPWMGNSARVQAGLSRTKLAQGADLQATLSEIGRGTSRRLNGPPTMTDSGEVDPSAAAQDTGSVAGAATTREPAGKNEPVRLLLGMPRKKAILIVSIGLGVLVAGALVGWAAFGRGKTPVEPTADNRPRSEQEQNPKPPKVEPKVEPKKNPVVTPKVEPPREVPVYKFEASELAPFRVWLKGGTVTDGKRGTLPTGLAVYALRPDTEAEFFAGPVDGTAALSITRLGTATGSQVAFELEREPSMQGLGLKLKPDTDHKVRVKYRTGAGQIEVSVHTIAGFKSAGYKVFGTTGDKWATVELPFRRGVEPLRLAVAALGEPRAPVAIAGVEVVEIPSRDLVAEKTLFRMDVAGQKPFAVRSGLTPDPNNPNKRDYRLVSQTGAEPPAGWFARVYNKDSEMEYFSEDAGGKPVLAIRGMSGPGSAMLFMPKFDCPTGACRLRFEYDASVREGKFAVRFKPSDTRPAWDVVKPRVTGGAWQTEEVEFDLKGAPGGYFEFHNTDERSSGAVRIRDVVVTEMKGALAEKVLYRLDATDLPTFKNTKLGRQKTSGDDDPKLKGVYFGAWKPESTSEWECKSVAGAKAVAISNTSEIISAQIGIELEQANGIGLKFEPGQRVRLRVVYRTAGKGRGSIYFQNYGDRKVPGRSDLPNSNTAWTTVDVIATRGDHGLRCLIDATATEPGSTLYVRSVTVSDAGRGGTTVAAAEPKPPAADDPANWAEGAPVYALDVAKVPAFRVVKEKSTRTTGVAEQLPAGIGCHCWKENAVGEFRCEMVDGAAALGLTNFNDEKSGQFFFALEGGMKLALQPGKAYRVKVGYMTRNDATGTATVHVVPGFKGIGSRTLPNTDGKWTTSAVSFIRPAAEESVEVRMVIDNTSVGEGNTVWVRSLEIVELIPPTK
jgi:serine/threonine protein kinase